MDLQTIAELTRLPVRKIRYVVDQRLLPGLRVEGQPDLVGRARILTDLEGYAVACAAILLESGVRKEAVVEFMAALSGFPMGQASAGKKSIRALQKAYEPKVTPAEAFLADGMNLRFKFGREDTGWLQTGTYAPLSRGYEPRMVISINLAYLRDVFLARR